MTKTLGIFIYDNLKYETIDGFRILSFGHCYLFGICDLEFFSTSAIFLSSLVRSLVVYQINIYGANRNDSGHSPLLRRFCCRHLVKV